MPFDLKLVFGMVGNATATALFLSPLPTFYKIVKKRSTEEFSGLPYVCTLFNCLLWVLYGLPFIKPHSMLILTINGFGVALELVYIVIFLTYAAKQKKMQMMKWILAVVVAYSVVILVVLLGLHSLTTRQLAAGSMCVVVAIAMYASPLSVMGLVIKTRSVEYMPFLLSLFNFLNGAVWSGYSIVTRDIFVAIPNGLGCLSGIAQLVLYAIYRNAEPIRPDEKQASAVKLAERNSKASADSMA
ncbi:hypothetical protein GOP47_0026759 [Adiantum capillus-veneris]|nr:hypothetical protein GOP47_0026759 [Adiantum capillus-veneris]